MAYGPERQRPSWWALAPGAEAVFVGEMLVGLTLWITLPDSGDRYGQGGWGAGALVGLLLLCVAAPVVLLCLGFLHSMVLTRPLLGLVLGPARPGTGRRIAAGAGPLSVAAGCAALLRCAGASWPEAFAWVAGSTVPPLLVAYLAIRGGTRPGKVVAGTSVATAALVLVGAATAVVLGDAGALGGYRPPALERAQYVGTWRGDGDDGVIRLGEDGRAEAERVVVGRGGASAVLCTGSGTWKERAEHPSSGTRAGVQIDVPDCRDWAGTWQVAGTETHPELFQTAGDPDAAAIRLLRRTSPSPR
ncbi:hypothetical protein AB0O57_24560 [Streptomyces sp. NPDC091201]|uniref:hypothetical protein n=1 Tax=Streptomyces sp. NPDC091201 TaxID=3155190 RepID=UPI003425E88E